MLSRWVSDCLLPLSDFSIVHDKSTLVTLGNLGSSSALICFFGLIVSGVLLALRVKGALLIGIFSSTVLALFMGDASLPHTALIQTPPLMAPTFLKFEWTHVFTVDMAVVLFTFLFVDLFDTIGTLVGVASQAKMLDAKGRFPHVNRALLADAVSIPSASVYRSLGAKAKSFTAFTVPETFEMPRLILAFQVVLNLKD